MQMHRLSDFSLDCMLMAPGGFPQKRFAIKKRGSTVHQQFCFLIIVLNVCGVVSS